MFVVVNMVELLVQQLLEMDLLYVGEVWVVLCCFVVVDMVKVWLVMLDYWFGVCDYLFDCFIVVDILMVMVLCFLCYIDLVEGFLMLVVYVECCEVCFVFYKVLIV